MCPRGARAQLVHKHNSPLKLAVAAAEIGLFASLYFLTVLPTYNFSVLTSRCTVQCVFVSPVFVQPRFCFLLNSQASVVQHIHIC